MKIVKTIIQENDGENVGTYTSIGFIENFKGDESELVDRFVSWDCNIPIETKRFRRVDVNIPSWMSESSYNRHKIDLKYAQGMAGDLVYEMSEDEFLRFIRLSSKQKFWYGWALKSKNGFIQSLVAQFESWIKGEIEYGSPLSQRQFESGSKYCPLWQVDGIESSVYRNSRY